MIQTMETIRFKNDGPTRKQLYAAEGMAHPAKGHLGLWAMMIEKYTKPGDLVLDPMAGVGATLMAALMGRNVVVNEREHHFLLPMVRSWAKMQQQPMLTGEPLGQVQIPWGDARNLAGATPWPYQELALRYPKAPDLPTLKSIRRKYRLSLVARTFPLGAVDSIITSPPYADSPVAQSSDGEANRRFRDGDYQGDALKGMGLSAGYTRPQSLPRAEHGVDAVVSSPPFLGSQSNDSEKQSLQPLETTLGTRRGRGFSSSGATTGFISHDMENIGNLKGAAYWTAQAQVYAECWRVLKPGGIMALVLKGFTRDGKYVDLPTQTLDLLLAAGWVEHDRWRRELWSLSFWRILQKRRDPAAFDERLNFEEVIAVRKPEGSGNGVAAVLTSPPYEEGLGHMGERQDERDITRSKHIHGGSRDYTRPGGG